MLCPISPISKYKGDPLIKSLVASMDRYIEVFYADYPARAKKARPGFKAILGSIKFRVAENYCSLMEVDELGREQDRAIDFWMEKGKITHLRIVAVNEEADLVAAPESDLGWWIIKLMAIAA